MAGARSCLSSLVAVFLPPLCLVCEAPLTGERPEICSRCVGTFRTIKASSCARCGAPAGHPGRRCRLCAEWSAIAHARSALLFGGGVRSWIHLLKYGGLTSLAQLAGPFLEDCFHAAPREWAGAGALVPVPLHRARKRERGFNQSELLAAELARRVGLPVLSTLERHRATAPQIGLSADARRENVGAAFRLREDLASFCRGRALILVDDVLTTGSTLEACAGVLMDGGSGPVYALTLARALPGHDG